MKATWAALPTQRMSLVRQFRILHKCQRRLRADRAREYVPRVWGCGLKKTVKPLRDGMMTTVAEEAT